MKKQVSILVAAMMFTTMLHAGDKVVKRGAAVSKGEAVSVEHVLKAPRDFSEKSVLVTGVIDRACTNKGCWMQVASQAGSTGVRVTFKDYKFFIPLDSAGMRVLMEGVTTVKTLSKADADHLVAEGAALNRNPDGTANEVSFVATGVELSK